MMGAICEFITGGAADLTLDETGRHRRRFPRRHPKLRLPAMTEGVSLTCPIAGPEPGHDSRRISR
jgi:hypothetical protein